jgi:GntR family transcriptional regulator
MHPTAVAYHPSVPLHVQIERVLRTRIESGEWESENPIPTELALVRLFGVSRTTIREALKALTRDGLIVRHRGRGSFVRPAPARPEPPPKITNVLLGYEVEIKVIKVETVPAPGHVVMPLGVDRGSPVARFVRVEIADGAPLAVVVNYMREELGRKIRPKDLQRLTMLELLRDRLGLKLGVIRQSFEARLPDEEVAGLLGIDLTQPVLFMRLVVPDTSGQPIEVCDTFYRADRYRYEVETRLPPRTPGRTASRGKRRAVQAALARHATIRGKGVLRS